LLVAESNLVAASRALGELGLRPMEEAAEHYAREHHHHLTYGGPAGSVELHFRLLTGFGEVLSGNGPLTRAVPFDLEGHAVQLLCPEDEALYLALHAANHVFARLGWLYDLKLLLAATPLDWDVVFSRAREEGLAGPAYVAFAVAERSVGAPVPASMAEGFRVSAWHRSLVDWVFTDARLEEAPWLEGKWIRFAANTALASTPGSLLRFAGHHTARGAKRRLAKRFPGRFPEAWGG
jgi:hypothetical protein